MADGSTASALDRCLTRIVADEHRFRAFTAPIDEARVRCEAATARDRPLGGMPIGVKDVLDTGDLTTEYGSPIWAGHLPRADAACVAWVRAAGAVVLGKTVTTEFATRKPGPTTNPHDPARTPGGSSSGSAAAVAAGFVEAAFGTQTAGSIIRPAAFCGIVGYKPSFGLIPRLGMKVMAESLDTIGTLGRSVAACARLAAAASHRDLGDPDATPGRPPRIGVCRTSLWPRAAPETVALFERLAGILAARGATVREADLPPDYAALETAHPLVMQAESARSMGWELTQHAARISDELRPALEWGLAQSDAALDDARETIATLARRLAEVFDDCDILLTPSAPGEAPVGLGWTGDPAFNFIWTALGGPCVTVPAGLGPHGMPLGVQIVGRPGDDRATLAWAAWVQVSL